MDILYSPGISFENPQVVKVAAPVRLRPWFYQETAIGPLTMVSKKDVWENDRQLHPYTPLWNRMQKDRNVKRLMANSSEMPNFEELGEAPGPTAAQSTMSRDPLGFLTSFISKTGEIATGVTNTMLQNADIKMQTNQSLIATQFAQMDTSYLKIAAVTGAVGLLAFYAWRKYA